MDTPRKISKRVTKAVILQRVDIVYDLLVKGLSRREILQFTTKQEPPWGVEMRQIDHYIAKANVYLEKNAAIHRGHELGKARARMEWLYQQNVKIQDYKAALATQQEISKLHGLYPELKGPSEEVIKVYIGINPEAV